MSTVTYLMLKRYKRFPLMDLEVFEHEFTSKILIITGANGSGKSSLNNELTQLPSDKNDFFPGGYKEIHYLHEGRKYILISDFTEGSVFRFNVDGVELNASNNISTQRELVFKHFKITQTIHDILVGKETFSNMSLVNRKKLFSAITHINIDKVLENYNKTKEELKNNELILKTNTSLLQAEEQKLANEDHLQKLKTLEASVKKHIEFLFNIRTELYKYKDSTDIDQKSMEFSSIKQKIKKCINDNYVILTAFPYKDLDNIKLNYTSQLNLINYQLNEIYSSLEQKEQIVKILEIAKQSDIAQLHAKQKHNKDSIELYKKSLFFYPDGVDSIDNVKSDVFKLESTLIDVVRTLPLNKERRFTKVRYEQLITEKEKINSSLVELTKKEIEISKEIEHLQQHSDNVVCPNCDHIWSLKNNPEKISTLKRDLTNLTVNKIKLQEQATFNSKAIDEIVEYFNLYRQYSAIRKATEVYLNNFWKVIDEQELVFNNPSEIAVLFRKLENEVVTLEQIVICSKDLEEVNKNLSTLHDLKETDLQQLERDIEELNLEAISLQSKKVTVNEVLLSVGKAYTIYNYINTLENALGSSKSDLFNTNIAIAVTDVLYVLESDLSKYKIVLMETEQELRQYDSIQYTISQYKKVIDDAQTNIKVLNIILDELSPKNGLIAKSVSSFLNVIISNINSTIESIWDYKMVLKAIDVGSEALNYRFKVEVEDKLPIDDISKCSMGMKKVINFSFILILYRLLGLEHHPLWLDEFTTNLDKNHTNRFVSLVNDLVSSDKFSQIFIVSHISNDYCFVEKNIASISLDD